MWIVRLVAVGLLVGGGWVTAQSGGPGGSGRPTWDSPRSLLDESRPPSPSMVGPSQRQAWQKRDLPELDQRVREMEHRPVDARELIEEQEWYYERERPIRSGEALPKPPMPPEGSGEWGKITPFELRATTQPATEPTTRPQWMRP